MSEDWLLDTMKKVAKDFGFNIDDAKEVKDIKPIVEEQLDD